MFGFEIIEIFIGGAGLLLVVNGIIFLFSSGYYNLFSGTFFIEKVSDAEKQSLGERIKKDHPSSRYIVGIFVIFFGLAAVAWTLGYKSALGWPFNLLF